MDGTAKLRIQVLLLQRSLKESHTLCEIQVQTIRNQHENYTSQNTDLACFIVSDIPCSIEKILDGICSYILHFNSYFSLDDRMDADIPNMIRSLNEQIKFLDHITDFDAHKSLIPAKLKALKSLEFFLLEGKDELEKHHVIITSS